jgi:transcriptional regulator with XRE-family HTH domain
MDIYTERYASAVAAELRAERGAQKVSFRALADSSGVTEASLLRYLNGQRDIPLPAFLAICEALGANPGSVMDRAAERMARQDG